MMTYFERRQSSIFYRILSGFIAFTFIFSVILPTPGAAQMIAQNFLNLPVPGTMVPLSAPFTPVILKGLTIHPNEPFRFDFIVDAGDSKLEGEALEAESMRLIKYFLASLTVPEEEMWVNLSPYEKDRIVPDSFGKTEMGRDLLAQDYILKQLTASLIYPESDLGKKFWDRVYKKARKEFGTTDIPINTFNKVWILPDSAQIYENEKGVILVDTRLKVMLDEDYLALENNRNAQKHGMDQVSGDDTKVVSGVSYEVIKEVIIPEIEREVNEGATFANLRQIYNSMVLATWYKTALKESLLGQMYVDKKKTKGLQIGDPNDNQKIYEQYVEAFKKGVYNYIKEEYDPAQEEMIPRKYFAGGATAEGMQNVVNDAMTASHFSAGQAVASIAKPHDVTIQLEGFVGDERVDLSGAAPTDSAMLTGLGSEQMIRFWEENKTGILRQSYEYLDGKKHKADEHFLPVSIYPKGKDALTVDLPDPQQLHMYKSYSVVYGYDDRDLVRKLKLSRIKDGRAIVDVDGRSFPIEILRVGIIKGKGKAWAAENQFKSYEITMPVLMVSEQSVKVIRDLADANAIVANWLPIIFVNPGGKRIFDDFGSIRHVNYHVRWEKITKRNWLLDESRDSAMMAVQNLAGQSIDVPFGGTTVKINVSQVANAINKIWGATSRINETGNEITIPVATAQEKEDVKNITLALQARNESLNVTEPGSKVVMTFRRLRKTALKAATGRASLKQTVVGELIEFCRGLAAQRKSFNQELEPLSQQTPDAAMTATLEPAIKELAAGVDLIRSVISRLEKNSTMQVDDDLIKAHNRLVLFDAVLRSAQELTFDERNKLTVEIDKLTTEFYHLVSASKRFSAHYMLQNNIETIKAAVDGISGIWFGLVKKSELVTADVINDKLDEVLKVRWILVMQTPFLEKESNIRVDDALRWMIEILEKGGKNASILKDALEKRQVFHQEMDTLKAIHQYGVEFEPNATTTMPSEVSFLAKQLERLLFDPEKEIKIPSEKPGSVIVLTAGDVVKTINKIWREALKGGDRIEIGVSGQNDDPGRAIARFLQMLDNVLKIEEGTPSSTGWRTLVIKPSLKMKTASILQRQDPSAALQHRVCAALEVRSSDVRRQYKWIEALLEPIGGQSDSAMMARRDELLVELGEQIFYLERAEAYAGNRQKQVSTLLGDNILDDRHIAEEKQAGQIVNRKNEEISRIKRLIDEEGGPVKPNDEKESLLIELGKLKINHGLVSMEFKGWDTGNPAYSRGEFTTSYEHALRVQGDLMNKIREIERRLKNMQAGPDAAMVVEGSDTDDLSMGATLVQVFYRDGRDIDRMNIMMEAHKVEEAINTIWEAMSQLRNENEEKIEIRMTEGTIWMTFLLGGRSDHSLNVKEHAGMYTITSTSPHKPLKETIKNGLTSVSEHLIKMNSTWSGMEAWFREHLKPLSGKKLGGIDLDSAELKMEIKRDGNGFILPPAQQPIMNMNIDGFVPVIINVAPITNFNLILGLDTTDDAGVGAGLPRPDDPGRGDRARTGFPLDNRARKPRPYGIPIG